MMVCVALFPNALANLFILALLGCVDALPLEVDDTRTAVDQVAWVLGTSAMQIEVDMPGISVAPDILQAKPPACVETPPASHTE